MIYFTRGLCEKSQRLRVYTIITQNQMTEWRDETQQGVLRPNERGEELAHDVDGG